LDGVERNEEVLGDVLKDINGSNLGETMEMFGHTAPRHSLELINKIIEFKEKATAGRPHKLLCMTDLKQCKSQKVLRN